MAPGRKKLRKLQWAKETTNGTAVTTATALWRGPGGMLDDGRPVTFPEEWVGIFGSLDRSYIAEITAALSLAETEATFEQLPYLLAMLYGGPVTGVADGSGSTGFKYVTTIPTNTVPTNTSYTIQGGDDFEVEIMEYAKCVKLVLKGQSKQAVKCQADLIGRQVSRHGTAFTPTNVSIITVEDALFGKSKLYLDAIGGTIGTTQITNQFLGYEITYEGMWIPKHTGDGNLYWSFAMFVDKAIKGKLTLEHDTAADGSTGIKKLLRDQTPRLMRIDTIGATYATPGTGTTFTGGTKGIRQDLPVKFTKVPPLEDIDGNDTVTVEFESHYNITLGNAGTITVCNEVSALP